MCYPGDGSKIYCISGLAWGIASDMILDYETTRQYGLFRYPLLKAKWGFFNRTKHPATIYYLPSDDDENNNEVSSAITPCDRIHPGCIQCMNGKVIKHHFSLSQYQFMNELEENECENIMKSRRRRRKSSELSITPYSSVHSFKSTDIPPSKNSSNTSLLEIEEIKNSYTNKDVIPLNADNRVNYIKENLNKWKKQRRHSVKMPLPKSEFTIEQIMQQY